MKEIRRENVELDKYTIGGEKGSPIGGAYFHVKEDEKPSLDEIISDKLSAYETDLLDSLASMETNEDVASYLANWGKNKKISTSQDAYGNVIFSIKASALF